MNQSAIFWPVIVQVALTYGIYALISRRRIGAIKAGNARPAQFRENQNEPAESLFVRNNLANQFELPVLFFAACLTGHAIGAADTALVVFAWIFALSRIGHAYIHVTSNRIRYRRPLFVIGFLALAAMWVRVTLSLAGIA